MNTQKLWRYTYCANKGGIVIADSYDDAREKLAKKYGNENIENALIWQWNNDDYYDAENPDVIDCYDA